MQQPSISLPICSKRQISDDAECQQTANGAISQRAEQPAFLGETGCTGQQKGKISACPQKEQAEQYWIGMKSSWKVQVQQRQNHVGNAAAGALQSSYGSEKAWNPQGCELDQQVVDAAGNTGNPFGSRMALRVFDLDGSICPLLSGKRK